VDTTGSDELPRGRHRIDLCADGTSTTILIGEKRVPATLVGCPDDVAAGGLGPWEVSLKRVPGPIEVSMVSATHPGCRARALLVPAVQRPRAAAGGASPAREAPLSVPAARVPAGTRQAFADFWSSLAAADAGALERRLALLASRSEAGHDVRAEWQRLERDAPTFARLAARLTRELGYTNEPGGGVQPAHCWVDRAGTPRCLAVLTDGP
jgi:hypothetical protein